MDLTTSLQPESLRRWHEAVNAGDIEAAAGLCTEDVAVAGPRGVGHGRDLVRAWLTRSGIRLTPLAEAQDFGGRYLVHELAQWTTADAPPGTPTTEPAETWCVFGVEAELLSSIARYETPAEAQAAASQPS